MAIGALQKFIPSMLVIMIIIIDHINSRRRKSGENVWRDVSLTVLSLHLARVKMLLLPRPRILKPHLCHSLAEAGYVRYPLKVLAVGIAVQLKIRLENG